MEPRHEESSKALEPGAAQKPRRFRIVKLEERIAPKMGGKGTHNCPYQTGVQGCYLTLEATVCAGTCTQGLWC
jgi:hypothetical protein